MSKQMNTKLYQFYGIFLSLSKVSTLRREENYNSNGSTYRVFFLFELKKKQSPVKHNKMETCILCDFQFYFDFVPPNVLTKTNCNRRFCFEQLRNCWNVPIIFRQFFSLLPILLFILLIWSYTTKNTLVSPARCSPRLETRAHPLGGELAAGFKCSENRFTNKFQNSRLNRVFLIIGYFFQRLFQVVTSKKKMKQFCRTMCLFEQLE